MGRLKAQGPRPNKLNKYQYLNINIHICLNGEKITTKTITITEEAYDALKRLKRKGESFSQLALRITHHQNTLDDCWGGWSDLTDEELAVLEAIKHSWDTSDRELLDRLKSL